MGLTKIIDGEVVPLSEEEEAATLAEWDANDPVKKPPPSYRDLRKAAYIKELGKVAETNFENATGDVLDILITQVELMRLAAGVKATDEYAARIAKIGEIKQRFPKA